MKEGLKENQRDSYNKKLNLVTNKNEQTFVN